MKAGTVEELIAKAKCGEIAIPVFQRASVWGKDDVRKLLESAVQGIPLGLFVLWQPQAPIPGSVRFGTDDPSSGNPLLIVDGQQRIRSFIAALSASEFALDDEDNCPKAWYAREYTSGTDRRWEFDLKSDRDERDSRAIATENWLRLSDLPVDNEPRKSILGATIHVHLLKDGSLADIVATYTRLNRVGSPMTPDERDFARLAAVAGNDIAVCLDDVFRATAKLASESAVQSASNRTDRYTRGAAKLFGLAEFLRVAKIFHAFHTGQPTANFAEWTDLEAPAATDYWPRLCQDVSKAMCTVVQEFGCLGCDDLSRLAEVSRLDPVFALVVRFPGLADHSKFIRSCIVRVLFEVTPNGVADTGDRCRLTWSAQTVQQALDAWSIAVPNQDVFRNEFDGKQSVRHRWTQLLYWVQRDAGATDPPYSNENLRDDHPLTGKESKPIHRVNEPQVGHILPRSRARPVGGRPVGHGRTHLINSLWNLTYMTADFNGLDGLSDRLPSFEGTKDENLSAHSMDGALLAWVDLCERWRKQADAEVDGVAVFREDVPEKIEKFRKDRLQSLAEQFGRYLVKHALVAAPDVERAMGRLSKSRLDWLSASYGPFSLKIEEFVSSCFLGRSGSGGRRRANLESGTFDETKGRVAIVRVRKLCGHGRSEIERDLSIYVAVPGPSRIEGITWSGCATCGATLDRDQVWEPHMVEAHWPEIVLGASPNEFILESSSNPSPTPSPHP